MRKAALLFCLIINPLLNILFAQLPPAAQALYDSAFNQDSILVKTVLNDGAQVFATPDGKSFYLRWFPTASVPSSTPVVVTLHGSHCNAFMEFISWYPRAKTHGCGIIALQWYRYQPNPPYDYFPDDTLYYYLDSALTKINYPSHKALLHGFSRGSARSYAIIFNDIQSGKNYFCTTMGNSGSADLQYPLYDSINSGAYGPNVFSGKRWNLFCGGKDTTVGCAKMSNTQSWLQLQGATVDIFIQDANLDHDGFQLQSSFAYKDSILNNYLLCYNGSLSVNETNNDGDIHVFPNPSSNNISITGTHPLEKIFLINTLGQNIQQLDPARSKFDLSDIPSGVYFLLFKNPNNLIRSRKVVKQ